MDATPKTPPTNPQDSTNQTQAPDHRAIQRMIVMIVVIVIGVLQGGNDCAGSRVGQIHIFITIDTTGKPGRTFHTPCASTRMTDAAGWEGQIASGGH